MVQNTFSHRGPQRCASVVQSSVRLARVQGLQHVTNLLPRALQHVERRDAQRCSRSTKTLACVQLSPEFRSRFIMSSSCDASSTCPIPSRCSWPPLHDSYSQTPGGTLFSTTPGGEMRLPSVFIFNSRIYFLTSDFVLHASFSRILQRTLFLCEVSWSFALRNHVKPEAIRCLQATGFLLNNPVIYSCHWHLGLFQSSAHLAQWTCTNLI